VVPAAHSIQCYILVYMVAGSLVKHTCCPQTAHNRQPGTYDMQQPCTATCAHHCCSCRILASHQATPHAAGLAHTAVQHSPAAHHTLLTLMHEPASYYQPYPLACSHQCTKPCSTTQMLQHTRHGSAKQQSSRQGALHTPVVCNHRCSQHCCLHQHSIRTLTPSSNTPTPLLQAWVSAPTEHTSHQPATCCHTQHQPHTSPRLQAHVTRCSQCRTASQLAHEWRHASHRTASVRRQMEATSPLELTCGTCCAVSTTA
jgi:hypothetical protein